MRYYTMSNRRFWTADLHLGHAKVAELRGFASVREHDTHILGQLAELDHDDVVWVLGDVTGGKSSEDEDQALALLSQMVSAELHLIAGNHDSVSATRRTGYQQQDRFREAFASIQQFGRIRLHRRDVMMSHYPYARSGDGPERESNRYGEYRLRDAGLPLIHGHTHQSEPHMTWPLSAGIKDSFFNGVDESQFCVSWDAHRGLVGEHQLNQWVERISA